MTRFGGGLNRSFGKDVLKREHYISTKAFYEEGT